MFLMGTVVISSFVIITILLLIKAISLYKKNNKKIKELELIIMYSIPDIHYLKTLGKKYAFSEIKINIETIIMYICISLFWIMFVLTCFICLKFYENNLSIVILGTGFFISYLLLFFNCFTMLSKNERSIDYYGKM